MYRVPWAPLRRAPLTSAGLSDHQLTGLELLGSGKAKVLWGDLHKTPHKVKPHRTVPILTDHNGRTLPCPLLFGLSQGGASPIEKDLGSTEVAMASGSSSTGERGAFCLVPRLLFLARDPFPHEGRKMCLLSSLIFDRFR